MSWSVHDLVALEELGTPTVVVATKPFAPLARGRAEAAGLPDARIVVVDHPLGGLDPDAVEVRAGQAAEQALALLDLD